MLLTLVPRSNSSDASPASFSLPATIAQLRSLCQRNIQANWHYFDGDLSPDEAVRPQTWQTWSIAELNAKNHIAWAKGQKVRWLGQTLVVPSHLQHYPLQGLALRLALGWWAEAAEIFVNGQQVQEGDLFDCSTRLLLREAVTPGETIAVAIRLVSPGHDDGALVRSVCLYESLQGLPEPSFVADELEVLQRYLSTFAAEKLEVLVAAVAHLDWSLTSDRPAFDQNLDRLRQQLLPFSDLIKSRTIRLLGHAHLDMAWLWAVDETWQAAERTFESVLTLQDEFPELIFCHSTPALYDWLETNRPELFDRIRQQIQTGRWEPIGGIWVEPELNLISGESIVRQILYGQQYFQEKFGRTSPIAWLPDTFGFNWQLPQFFQQGGIDYFVTQKLRWNDTTQFPHELFWWQAPDGSRVLSVMSAPIGEGIDPLKMTAFACDWERKTGISVALWLPGVGDHGGGPTRDMLQLARRWQQSPFFPQLEFTTAEQYLQPLLAAKDAPTPSSTPQDSALPVWNDELYLEFHRGCYTTHADQKRSNRRSEDLLYQAELWASLATLGTGAEYPKPELEAAWKKVLFNQFHDILPGSSIAQVFTDANQDWQAVDAIGQAILARSLAAIAHHIAAVPPTPTAQLVVVFNSLNGTRSQVVTVALFNEEPGQENWSLVDSEMNPIAIQENLDNMELGLRLITFQAEAVPGVGYRCFWLCPGKPASAIASQNSPWMLENQFLRATVDSATGNLSSLFDKTQQREVLKGAGNELQAFADSGQYWDAWNIDPNYAQHPLAPAELLEVRWLERGDVRSRLQVVRRIEQSIFEQEYILDADSPVLKVSTQVDWQERHVLVKVAFPLTLQSNFATYEIPCGAIERPTQATSDREKAMWEVPALRWADLNDGTYGVSLLTDCKHGFDIQPSQLRLTLLRGTAWPDPDADRGIHRFTYALYPHAGTWQSAKTVQQAQALNQPLQAVLFPPPHPSSHPHTNGNLPLIGRLLNLSNDRLSLMAFKQSEDNPNEWVLRCCECHGEEATLNFGGDLNLQLVEAVNLLEQPIAAPKEIQGQYAIVGPWKIASFRVTATK